MSWVWASRAARRQRTSPSAANVVNTGEVEVGGGFSGGDGVVDVEQLHAWIEPPHGGGDRAG